VVSRGSSGDGFFIVAEGEATVLKAGVPVGQLRKNDCFGEVALIDGGRRSADIQADTNMRCWGISRKTFKAFVQEHPEVSWALLETLARRLRASDRPQPAPARPRRWLRDHAPRR
jgi:CRP-like cAMP-binding protein